MTTRVLLFATLLSLTASLHPEPSSAQGKPAVRSRTRTLTLHLSNPPTRGYTKDLLTIERYQGKTVRGSLALQFGIGPQARRAMPWEHAHVKRFSGSYDARTGKVSFKVSLTIAFRKQVWSFTGYRIKRGVNAIAGTYTINGKLQGGFYAVEQLKRP